MKHETSEKIQCPCCKEEREVIHETSLLMQENELRVRFVDPWWGKEGWSLKEARTGELQWACNFCLETGRALPAQPWLQSYCDYSPYFSYFDVSIVCEDCQTPFVFAGSEQLFWYETLKFWVQSRPKQCVPCRRIRRERANENRRLQKLHDEKKRAASENPLA